MQRGPGFVMGEGGTEKGEGSEGERRGVLEQVLEKEDEGRKGLDDEGKKGLVEKVWMGGEREGWRERRIREEKEAIEEGRGYGGLIMDQIWEVWNWGKKSDGEEEEDGKR